MSTNLPYIPMPTGPTGPTWYNHFLPPQPMNPPLVVAPSPALWGGSDTTSEQSSQSTEPQPSTSFDVDSSYIGPKIREELLKFSGKVDSHYVPTDLEASHMRELLSGPSQQLNTLDEEIQSAQTRLAQLQNDRRTLEAQLHPFRTILTPIRKLPLDILREIFLHCMPEGQYKGSMRPSDAPLLLMRVCSSWRGVAIATPRLWASVYITVPTTHVHAHHLQQQQQLALGLRMQGRSVHPTIVDNVALTRSRAGGVVEWLGRSGGLPLDVTIVYQQFDAPSFADSQQAIALFNALKPFYARLRSLKILAPSGALTTLNSLELRPSQIPNLEELRIIDDFKTRQTVTHPGHPGQMMPSFHSGQFEAPFLLQAPKLSFLSLKTQHNPNSFSMKWAQLTTLKLHVLSGPPNFGLRTGQQVFEIVKRCPNLIDLFINFSGTAIDTNRLDAAQQTLGPVILPSLASLTITGRADISGFFPILDVPALKEFGFICDVSWPQGFGPAHLLQFMEKVSDKLEKFTVDPKSFTRPVFIQMLRLCSALTALCFTESCRITGEPRQYAPPRPSPAVVHAFLAAGQQPPGQDMTIDDSFIDLLSPHEEDGMEALCPLLKHFSCNYPMNFSERALSDLIERKRDNEDVEAFEEVDVVYQNLVTGCSKLSSTSTVAGAQVNVSYQMISTTVSCVSRILLAPPIFV